MYYINEGIHEICTELDDYTGIPGECNKYKRCMNGHLNIYVCEFGTFFDYIKKKCVDADEVNCLELPTENIPEVVVTTRPFVIPNFSRPGTFFYFIIKFFLYD